MATRSVVARLTESGIEGRYVHWDGYPIHMMTALYELIRRDGYETVTRILLDEHDGWSSINPFQEDDEETLGHVETLEYWGKYYTDTPNEPFFTTLSEAYDAWAEYVYIIVAEGEQPVEIRCYRQDTEDPIQVVQVLCDHEYDSYCANCGVDS